MATEVLVDFTEGGDESEVQTIGQDEFHTLYPVFGGGHGAVVVKAVLADDTRRFIARLTGRVTDNPHWQLRGPMEYGVQVKNAGCDVDTGV